MGTLITHALRIAAGTAGLVALTLLVAGEGDVTAQTRIAADIAAVSVPGGVPVRAVTKIPVDVTASVPIDVMSVRSIVPVRVLNPVHIAPGQSIAFEESPVQPWAHTERIEFTNDISFTAMVTLPTPPPRLRHRVDQVSIQLAATQNSIPRGGIGWRYGADFITQMFHLEKSGLQGGRRVFELHQSVEYYPEPGAAHAFQVALAHETNPDPTPADLAGTIAVSGRKTLAADLLMPGEIDRDIRRKALARAQNEDANEAHGADVATGEGTRLSTSPSRR